MTLLLALLLLPSVQDERKPKGLAGVGLTAEQVNRAVDRGVAYYRQWYATSKFGASTYDIVAALAILHAGGHRKHPDLGRKVRAYVTSLDPSLLGTYELGVLAMICEFYGDSRMMSALRASVQRLLDSQGEGGSWGYGGEDAASARRMKESGSKPARLRVAGGRPLDLDRPKGPILRRKNAWTAGDNGKDNSASQYAVLGLYSAHRAGLSVDPEAWKRARHYYREGQSRGEGWGYGPGDDPYGSMTTAGVASVAICSYALGEKEWRRDPSVKRGLAWLARNFAVDRNPGGEEGYHYYYLYGLERVGRILGTEFIGDHEWYPLGARFLVDAQQKDGRWEPPRGHAILDTGFALLFLTRATPTPVEEGKRGGKGRLETAVSAGAVYHLILDASGSMMARIEGRPKADIAREAVLAIAESLPEGIRMGLRVYGHRRRALDPGADEDTELVVPIGPLDKKTFTSLVRRIGSRGKTPLTLSLRECVADLEAVEQEPVTVILLTDGGESTRGADPVAAARELVKARPGAVVHVVAFDVNDPRARRQLEAIARAGGGRCLPALRAAELRTHLGEVFGTRVTYELADGEGRKIADGLFGDRRELPEGKYRLRGIVRGEQFDEEIWINTDRTTTVTIELAPEKAVASARRRGVPRASRKGVLELTVEGKKVVLPDLAFTFTPATDEDAGSVVFEGPLTASIALRARRVEGLEGAPLRVRGEFTLTIGDQALVGRRATVRIRAARKFELTGTIEGVFVRREKPLPISGKFRAVRKDPSR